MAHAHVRFYADLNSFLAYQHRQEAIVHHFMDRVSIKDMVESLGVPHTEVDLLLVNGEPVDFNYIVQDGDRISVYPRFMTLDISSVTRTRAVPPAPHFVVDIHLGKLATYLRLMGFDTLFPADYDDANLARIAHEENRIMLTRDRGLLKRNAVTHGFYVRSTTPRKQLIEVLRRFDLTNACRPLTRCLRCNGLLHPVEKAAIADRLEPATRRYYDEFRQCIDCQQVYWKGAHFKRLEAFVADALAQGGRRDIRAALPPAAGPGTANDQPDPRAQTNAQRDIAEQQANE